jgi:hypothetical protein
VERGDLTADREPEARASWFGREKRLEHPRSDRRVDAAALIRDSNDDDLITGHKANVDLNQAALGHCFYGIAEEIDEKLNELVRIGFDYREVARASQIDSDVSGLGCGRMDGDDVYQQRPKVHRGELPTHPRSH